MIKYFYNSSSSSSSSQIEKKPRRETIVGPPLTFLNRRIQWYLMILKIGIFNKFQFIGVRFPASGFRLPVFGFGKIVENTSRICYLRLQKSRRLETKIANFSRRFRKISSLYLHSGCCKSTPRKYSLPKARFSICISAQSRGGEQQ